MWPCHCVPTANWHTRKSSRHPFHIIQASLALDRLEDIFARLRQQVDQYFTGNGEPEE
jgi:hypothetical protein